MTTGSQFSRTPSSEPERQLYREVAQAYRDTRRQGGKPHQCHWQAVAAVQQVRPWLPKREAEALAATIIRIVSQEFPGWFWK
jgi:hypothetical protein